MLQFKITDLHHGLMYILWRLQMKLESILNQLHISYECCCGFQPNLWARWKCAALPSTPTLFKIPYWGQHLPSSDWLHNTNSTISSSLFRSDLYWWQKILCCPLFSAIAIGFRNRRQLLNFSVASYYPPLAVPRRLPQPPDTNTSVTQLCVTFLWRDKFFVT